MCRSLVAALVGTAAVLLVSVSAASADVDLQCSGKAAGTRCDDGASLTINDQCTAGGVCRGVGQYPWFYSMRDLSVRCITYAGSGWNRILAQ